MDIFYEKPENTYRGELFTRKDNDGNRFWIYSSDWNNPIEVNAEEKIKSLPEEIRKLFPKWRDDFAQANKKECWPGYPIKLSSIKFIFENNVYKLEPEAFENSYGARYPFLEIHEIIEKDLREAGAIYTFYNDFFD